jgi:hypothetical protein
MHLAMPDENELIHHYAPAALKNEILEKFLAKSDCIQNP